MKTRSLKNEETRLIRHLLSGMKEYDVLDWENQLVTEMDDGGMGSLYFGIDKGPDERGIGKCIAEQEFIDSDDIPISVTINVDNEGAIMELDIWKADFSSVMNYPLL